MKKVVCLLSICTFFLSMIQCTDDKVFQIDNQSKSEVEPIEKSWDLRSISILESMKQKVIEDKIKSLSKDELKTYEKDLIAAYNQYRANPTDKSLKKYINFLGFTDTKDFLFKTHSIEKL